jgi:hypothetical protein
MGRSAIRDIGRPRISLRSIRATDLIVKQPNNNSTVIASQRVGAKRRPMTGSAKQSSLPTKKETWIASSWSLSSGAHSRDPLAPRNDVDKTRSHSRREAPEALGGSASTIKTRLPMLASWEAMLNVSVVFPTPPLWLQIENRLAGARGKIFSINATSFLVVAFSVELYSSRLLQHRDLVILEQTPRPLRLAAFAPLTRVRGTPCWRHS